MGEQFKWVSFYTEFATKLLEYMNERPSLIMKLQNVYSSIGMKFPNSNLQYLQGNRRRNGPCFVKKNHCKG